MCIRDRYRFMRRGSRDRQDLRLPDRLHFTEKICTPWACRFPAGGGLHLQRCPAGRHHWGIHPVFIPDFSGEPHHPLELVALVGSGTGYALVSIDVNEFPIAVGLY